LVMAEVQVRHQLFLLHVAAHHGQGAYASFVLLVSRHAWAYRDARKIEMTPSFCSCGNRILGYGSGIRASASHGQSFLTFSLPFHISASIVCCGANTEWLLSRRSAR